MVSVVIVEDLEAHQIYLRSIIERDPSVKCLDVINNGREALLKIPYLNPDIVLMDIGLPDITGIDCIIKLKNICPAIKFMVCTVHQEDEKVYEALKAGALSYMLKKSKPHQIIDAIQELNDGGAPISSDIARKILNEIPKIQNQDSSNKEFRITSREAEILNLLAKGQPYQEIADGLFISIKTFKKHIYNIYQKLQADNRTEALNKYFGTN
jgi:DNA-binding NarL/FixJ family response regulator